VIRQVDALRRLAALQRLVGGQHRRDTAAGHGDAVVGEHRAGGLDRDDPARADEQIDSYRAGPLREMMARRLGARQAMSALRSLSSGQNFAGTVLPMPM